jgi:hypothetical protein
MTDPALLIIDHKNALLNRIKEDTILAKCGFEGVVLPDPVTKKRPERYWTVFTDSGARFTDRLAGMSTSANLMYWIHCVGTTPEQAQMHRGSSYREARRLHADRYRVPAVPGPACGIRTVADGCGREEHVR